MITLQEIVDLADAMQLRGGGEESFIVEEMDKLRHLQIEERKKEREARLQIEERQLNDSVKPVTFNSQSKTTDVKKPEVPICYICKKQGHRAGECRSNNVTKQNLGRGSFYCGEMTHVRRDCQRLKWEGNKVSSAKRAGLALARVVETCRECLGIVWGITKFAMYLYGKPFTLQTDHRPLQFLSASKFESQCIMRWALALQSYNFEVEHIKEKENVGADFLSRAVE